MTSHSVKMASKKVFQLTCAVQTYAWGKLGEQSEVASLSKNINSQFQVDENTPYAELWMGTHPKGPSVITSTGEPLSKWIEDNPQSVGEQVLQRFPTVGQLPFLFKVLSVNKSLSIQAHPNKILAEQLHADKPDKYPDANHKPEMAIALTPFEGLCGFRPRKEIVKFLQEIPEFRKIIGEANMKALDNAKDASAEKVALQNCFSSLMTSDSDTVAAEVTRLAERLNEAISKGENIELSLGELFLRLNSQFPGDCGCFCIYFLNHMLLQPGEAMFLEANLPHAYLSGDCMECMACSDNVVRAGLTPKFKDVPTLCDMLNYTGKPAEDNLFESRAHSYDSNVIVYDPPIPDFTVARIEVPNNTSYSLQPLDGASIALVIKGEAQAENKTPGEPSLKLQRGVIIFIAAGETLQISVSSESLLMFRAYCQV